MSPTDVPLAILALAFLLALVRMALGPSVADRVIAAELGAAVLVAAMPLLAVRLDSSHLLDVAILAALLQFVATSALASLLLPRPTDDQHRGDRP